MLAAALNMYLTDRFGFGKVLHNMVLLSPLWYGVALTIVQVVVLAATSQVFGYVLAAPAPPSPVFLLGYLLNGFGISLQVLHYSLSRQFLPSLHRTSQLSASNSFVTSYKDGVSTRLAVLHSFYGLGALASPLVATQFAQMRCWSFYYLVSLGLALVNVGQLTAVFRLRTHEGVCSCPALPHYPLGLIRFRFLFGCDSCSVPPGDQTRAARGRT